MGKLYFLLVCMMFAYTSTVSAKVLQQKPAAPAKPVAAAPKGNPPYVLKKDYDLQIMDMGEKISNAVNSTAALRRNVGDKLEKVILLDSQMQNVEKILNSASFQIALTSDSLKETRFSMAEFRKNAEESLAELHHSNSDLKNYLFIFFGGALLISIVLFIVILTMMSSKIKILKTTFQQQSKEFQMNLSDKMQKHEIALTDDLNSTKNRMQYDISIMKNDITDKMNSDNEELLSQIKLLTKKISDLENLKKG